MPFGFSAGPVQIATCNFPPRSCDLFTLPPHAPCRLQHGWTIKLTTTLLLCLHTPRADCNGGIRERAAAPTLCLHTPRADCNKRAMRTICATPPLPPHAPCRLQPGSASVWAQTAHFASTRPVQIATLCAPGDNRACALPPHAPCRLQLSSSPVSVLYSVTLPPHAPCRLQRRRRFFWKPSAPLPPHAPCRLQQGCR